MYAGDLVEEYMERYETGNDGAIMLIIDDLRDCLENEAAQDELDDFLKLYS